MVVHFSSKLSHLAQSFRPQHHLNSIRSAFPSASGHQSASSSTFFCPSNAGPNAAPSNTYFSATPPPSNANASQPAGTGSGGQAGGAGGSKWSTGRAPNWAFQSRIANAPVAVHPDLNARLADEDQDEACLPRSSAVPRPRSQSLTKIHRADRRPTDEASPLFLPEELGLSGQKLASTEMQKRYKSAFARGERTQELILMEKEADEMDLGPPVSDVRRSGRRASISKPMVSTPPVLGATYRPAAPVRSARSPSSATRDIHVAATSTPRPFLATSPPLADVPRKRRNSTSAINVPPPPMDDIITNAPRRTAPRSSRRPPSSAKQDAPQQISPHHKHLAEGFASAGAQERYQGIVMAQQTRNLENVKDAVRRYLAVESEYNTQSHNAAISAYAKSLRPIDPLTPILDLYNQLYDHPKLAPTQTSYDLVIQAFCTRDMNIHGQVSFLKNRIEKRKLAAEARGPWYFKPSDRDAFVRPEDTTALEELRQQDFLSPALDIYKALGKMADSLREQTILLLLRAATKRRRVDLALTIYERLEKSPYQRINSRVYETLLDLYAQEKDADGVTEVFNAYLEARSKGMREAVGGFSDSSSRIATKHSASLEPGFDNSTSERLQLPSGDELIWRATIRSLFACGDVAGAVALIDRVNAALATPEDLPVGYPSAPLGQVTMADVIIGFLSTGDGESAERWYDQVKPFAQTYKEDLMYRAGNNNFVSLANKLYRSMLDDLQLLPSVSHLVYIIDVNLRAIHLPNTTSSSVQTSLDAVEEFSSAFLALARQGRGREVPPDFTLSTGVLGRIAAAQASQGRYDAAADTFSRLATAVQDSIVGDAFRTPDKWVAVLTTSAAQASNFTPVPGFDFSYSDGQPRPSLAATTRIVNDYNDTLSKTKRWPNESFELAVVESYLAARTEAKGDVASLVLDGAQWFAVIEAFAAVHSYKKQKRPAGFPGFEPIIDDLAAAGVTIPELDVRRYKSLTRFLVSGGMPRKRVAAVLSFLDKRIAAATAENALDFSESEVATIESESVANPIETSPLDSAVEGLDSDVTLSSALSTAPSSLPTPPSTPPSYFQELPIPQLPEVDRGEIDANATARIDDLLARDDLPTAYNTTLAAAEIGQFVHPDAVGRLIEVLGRQGQVNEVRQLYLAAYSSLAVPSMEASPNRQSLAWVMLEDRMIIALAHVGLLTEVAVHRNRLVAAGSAPSADAYAAMILNMKETTDDASVALQLFEESQANNVAPNVYLFNTLISKLSRARRAREAITYFELMKQLGLQPSAITYGAVINACCKTGDDKAADYLFQEMVKSPGFKPRVPPYNTMIQFYANTKPDRERALYYYDQLVKARVAPTGHTYKLLLDAYGSIGEPDIPSLTDVFNTLLADPKVTVTGAHWASLINAYGCALKDTEKALNIFNSIATHRSTPQPRDKLPDAVVYESLFNVFVANERSDLCDHYLADMTQRGVRMTAYVANTLIKGYTAQKQLDKARNVFESLEDPPSGVAAAGNHPVERHPQHRQGVPAASDRVVYREPSTWEAMLLAEIGAGEVARASVLMTRLEHRAFPEPVVNRIRQHMNDIGAISLSSE